MVYMEDPIWFSPLNVIFHFTQYKNDSAPKDQRQFKKAEEAFFVATMLVGIIAVQKKEYWMQIVSDKNGSPDIRTGNYKAPRGTPMNHWTTQEVEVVTFDEHSDEKSIPEFLRRTKLSKRKAYDPLTTILCYIRKDFHIPPLQTLVVDLQTDKCQSPIILLGKTSPNQETYKIAQINPRLDLVNEFDLLAELKGKKYTGVLNLKRGSTPIFHSHPDDKHYPFEKIGIFL